METAETMAVEDAGAGGDGGGGVAGGCLMERAEGAGTDPTGLGQTMVGVAAGAAGAVGAVGAAGVAAAAAAVAAATAVMATRQATAAVAVAAVALEMAAGRSQGTAPKRLPSGLPLAAAGGHPGRWWRHALERRNVGRQLLMEGRMRNLWQTPRVRYHHRRVVQTGRPLWWCLAQTAHPPPSLAGATSMVTVGATAGAAEGARVGWSRLVSSVQTMAAAAATTKTATPRWGAAGQVGGETVRL